MVLSVQTDKDNVPFIQLGYYQLRLDLEELDEMDRDRAVRELQETPENMQRGLTRLREFLQAEQHLHVPKDDEKFLRKFLRPCRHNPELAFRILRNFYKFKVKHPKYGVNITPNSVRHVFDNDVFRFLPTRGSDGERIMIINCGAKWNPKEVKLDDMIKAVMAAIEIAMLEPKTQLGGVHVILDMAGLSLNHIYQFSPSSAKLILDWVQECAPVRLKGIHVINQPYIFNMLFAIFKPFLGERLKKLIHFHGTNRTSLAEKIGEKSLTEYYGGTADIPEFPGSLFSDMLFFYEEDFKLYGSYGYNTDK